MRRDGFAESGGESALAGRAAALSATALILGQRTETAHDLGRFRVRTSGMIGWQHVLGDPVPRSIHGFAAGDAFAVAGSPVVRDSLLVEAGFEMPLSPTATSGARYAGRFTRNEGDNAVPAALPIDFQAGENGGDAGRDGSAGHGRTDRGKDKGLTQALRPGRDPAGSTTLPSRFASLRPGWW